MKGEYLGEGFGVLLCGLKFGCCCRVVVLMEV